MKLGNPVREVRTVSRLLTGAEREARSMGDTMAGAEHLLLSALAMPDGSARRAFERVGADPDAFRPAIAAQHAEALMAVGIEPPDDDAPGTAPEEDLPPPRGAFRTTGQAQAAFREAVALAKSVRPSRLVGAHVVVGVAGQEHGTAARALRHMGVDREALAAAAREEVGAPE
ncbi:MAG: Clp protease N-terminal domain-containing protein [Actinomycetota bacterium]